MRVRLGDEATMAPAACADAVRRIVQAQCGVEFSNFLASVERFRFTKQKTVHFYDIRGGLLATRRAALAAREHLPPGELSKKASSLSRSVTKLLSRHEGDGKVPPSDIPRLREDIRKLQKDFQELLQGVRKSCGAPP